ncbi:conserved hypothetical protein [Magnetospirillum sp. LM-5]|uniref:hypothetical protein n=1 Tax=Magnetospirillum sp. LM-5 TaxID=2681466 RepID=UPI00138414F0|nr:hypothetical protein [Magnetospirillum sp. LM-5]CAA7614261.1 conserved hypothetical protein [Magnetospirillum sp. LM-5]
MPDNQSRDHLNVVRKITATLQGPVVGALAELVPEVRALPRRTALDTILDDVDLLNRCFMAFRANTDQFRHLLVDRHKVTVEDADALLECGRSLDDVIAMVVRTAAKRHFRLRLDGSTKPRKRKAPNSRRGLFAKLRSLVTRHHPRTTSGPLTQGEVLYNAFQEYLLHDWQVPIIPEYVQMNPGMVRRLGERLLEYRLPEDIRRLRSDPDNPPPPTPVVSDAQTAGFQVAPTAPASLPVSVTGAERLSDGMAKIEISRPSADKDERARLSEILTPDGKRLQAKAFANALLDPKVREVIPNAANAISVTGKLGIVSASVGKKLVGDLALRVDQLAVFLMSANAALGDENFEKAFGVPGRPDYVAKIVQRAQAANLGQASTNRQIADFITRLFAAAAQKTG